MSGMLTVYVHTDIRTVVTSGMYCIIHTGNPLYYRVHNIMPKLYGYFDTYTLGRCIFCAVNVGDTHALPDDARSNYWVCIFYTIAQCTVYWLTRYNVGQKVVRCIASTHLFPSNMPIRILQVSSLKWLQLLFTSASRSSAALIKPDLSLSTVCKVSRAEA